MATIGAINSRKRGMFAEPDELSKRQCTKNPEYFLAFKRFDADGNGTIDIRELSSALQAVKDSIESPTARALALPTGFHANTVLWLASRFAPGQNGTVPYPQFAEMMQYVQSVKAIFQQIDIDNTGDLSVAELSRALSLSGFNVTGERGGGDPLSLLVAERIGRAYDADHNGVLTFDEFIQLRLEWDCYLNAWGSHVVPGTNALAPQQLLAVLESVKASLEPVGVMAMLPALAQLEGLTMRSALNSLFYTSMFKTQRPFHIRTAETLIRKFGSGSLLINFEQFCMMMEFLKEIKSRFAEADISQSGAIDINELDLAFRAHGLPMPIQDLVVIAKRYDEDNSGVLEFDEFLQMMVEISPQ